MSYGVDLPTLGAREGWTCWVCSGEVDPAAPALSPHAGSIDHVIPRARGGSNDSANLRLAHRRCNGQRGSAVPELDWPPDLQVFEPAPLWTAATRAQRRPGDWEVVAVVAADSAGPVERWLSYALSSIFGGSWELRHQPLPGTGLSTLALRTPPRARVRHRGTPRR